MNFALAVNNGQPALTGPASPRLSVYIHPDWINVVPPSYSFSHPVLFPPFLPTPTPKTTGTPHHPAPSKVRKPTAIPALPSPSDTSSEWSGDTGRSKEIAANEIFFTSGDATSVKPPTPAASRPTSKAGERPTKLDRYAGSYHPLWLRTLPPPIQTLRLPPTPPFPSVDYTSQVYSPRHLSAGTTHLPPLASLLAQPRYNGQIRPFDDTRAIHEPGYYAEHFTALLSLVLQAQVEEMEKALIHMVLLHISPNAEGGAYRLDIPGIREDTPHLSIGDRLVLRGLYPDLKAPGTLAVETEVVGLVKAKGWVYVRSSHLAEVDASLPRDKMGMARYQVQFYVSAAPLCEMQDAVRTFDHALKRSAGSRSTAARWLFPETLDIKATVEAGSQAVRWVDPYLNEEQKSAVKAIISDHNARVPFLISGPPGTGKTKTLVEAVLQVLKNDPTSSVLLCAPSNPAADILAKRLARFLGVTEMLRLNAPNRTFAEVPDEVLMYCCIKDDRFDLPPFEQLMQFKVVVCGCLDAGILVSAHATNGETMRAQVDLHTILHPRGRKVVDGSKHRIDPHWTHLMVDEAGQASEPEVLIPLSVVLPYGLPDDIESYDPLVILCGDVHQLGPVIASQAARDGELDVSLLERLFQRELYAKHPLARKNLNKATQLLERTLAESYRPCFTNLVKNYRSMPSILMIPAALFYEDTLEPAAQDVSLIKWSGLPNPEIPILFRGCETEEDWIEEGASWYNEGEISIIVEIVRSLLAERPDIRQEQIAVITPWREQVWRTRARLRANKFGGVDVGNVETYQGGEFRVTIISCVRSRARFLPDDRRLNMGLFNERKRFNVAITRAKELLIVVGNANLLKGDPFWNGFLQIMLRNNLYQGPDLDMEMTGAYISRLESTMRKDVDRDSDEAGLLLAGAMAREALRD